MSATNLSFAILLGNPYWGMQATLLGMSAASNPVVLLCIVATLVLSGASVTAEVIFVAAAILHNARLLLVFFLPVGLSSFFEIQVVLRRLEVSRGG